jgi:uncharacterized coiled-coil DUF342 family protein
MIEFSRGNYEQKSRQILEATRGLSSTDLEGTHLIECLRSQLSAVTEEIKRLRNERDEARRECRLLLLGQEVLRGVRDLPAPPDDLVTIVPVPRNRYMHGVRELD